MVPSPSQGTSLPWSRLFACSGPGQLHRLHASRLGSPCCDWLPFLVLWVPRTPPFRFTGISAGKRISEVGAQTLKVVLSLH